MFLLKLILEKSLNHMAITFVFVVYCYVVSLIYSLNVLKYIVTIWISSKRLLWLTIRFVSMYSLHFVQILQNS